MTNTRENGKSPEFRVLWLRYILFFPCIRTFEHRNHLHRGGIGVWKKMLAVSKQYFGTWSSLPFTSLMVMRLLWLSLLLKENQLISMHWRKYERAQGNDIKWFHSTRNVLQFLMNHIVVTNEMLLLWDAHTHCNYVYTLEKCTHWSTCLVWNGCLQSFFFPFQYSFLQTLLFA